MGPYEGRKEDQNIEGIELFEVPNIAFETPAHFREYLASEFEPAEILHNLTMIAGLTELNAKQLEDHLSRHGFKVVRRYGSVVRIARETPDGQFETYLTLDPGPLGVLLFFSNYRKTEELKLLQDFLEVCPSTYRLFLRPVLVKRILDELMSSHEDLRILDFTASRNLNSRTPAKLRPNTQRTVRYWAQDGREVLGELSDAYGVVPKKLRVDVPGVAKFSLDNVGAFTFFEGNLGVLLGIVKTAVESAVADAEILRKAHFELYPASIPGEAFTIPVSSPADIALEVRLDVNIMPTLLAKLEEQEFVPFNTSIEEGSLFFRSDVLDLRSSQLFRLRADQGSLRVLPGSRESMKPLLRFYEFVLEELDARAELVA